ncbi:MAG TPA: glycosyl transferase family 2 [Armatimonadetes bacterium]|nr:glycosyl transferase family 2 [Armatimonadota bacterium]
MQLSVIVSTYNEPGWLEKALWGWEAQTERDFELLIADDGSGPETAACIERLRGETGLSINHVWQEDRGFRKSMILNRAIEAAGGDYLVFSDGDCIPRADFLATHMRFARPGHYLSGGYFKLPKQASDAVTHEDVQSGRLFTGEWLDTHDVLRTHKRLLLTSNPAWSAILNRISRTVPTWNGHSASGWKSDLVAVNGFNEAMGYGGQDRELGYRLVNLGVRPVRIRFSTICMHLEHPQSWRTEEAVAASKAIIAETVRSRRTWIDEGIRKPGAAPTA